LSLTALFPTRSTRLSCTAELRPRVGVLSEDLEADERETPVHRVACRCQIRRS